VTARLATPADAEAIARIYSEGIADRTATFETRTRGPEDVQPWFDGRHPVVAVEHDGELIAFAAMSAYSHRECYAGIAEISLYVGRAWRGRGAGRLALNAAIAAAREAGFWKLVSRIFAENTASRRLVASLGFREAGTHEKHGRLDGVWRDVVIVERLIPENLG
jgi:L-amino acid N-acyltransferase YncA